MTHSNETQHNDTQHNDTQHNDTQHNDTQNNDTQHNVTHHNSKTATISQTLPLSKSGSATHQLMVPVPSKSCCVFNHHYFLTRAEHTSF